MKKVNLGCGGDYRKGFINTDFNRSVKADAYFDLRKKFPFKNEEINFILLQDVLEHFTREDAKKLLLECHRVLKIGGKIEIRIPNVYQLFEDFGADSEVLFRFIYGDTSKNGEMGSHKYGYTQTTLKKFLKSLDFVPISLEDKTTNIIAVAKKRVFQSKLENIAFSFLDSEEYGGSENFVYQLSTTLLKKINNITFFIFRDTIPKELKSNGKILVAKFPFRLDFIGNKRGFVKSIFLAPVYFFICIFRLYIFKNNGGNLIVITSFSDKIFLTIAAKLLGINVIWIEYGPLQESFRRNFYLPKVMYRLVKNLPDFVISPSENTKKSLIEDARISEAKIKVIPCGIDLHK